MDVKTINKAKRLIAKARKAIEDAEELLLQTLIDIEELESDASGDRSRLPDGSWPDEVHEETVDDAEIPMLVVAPDRVEW